MGSLDLQDSARNVLLSGEIALRIDLQHAAANKHVMLLKQQLEDASNECQEGYGFFRCLAVRFAHFVPEKFSGSEPSKVHRQTSRQTCHFGWTLAGSWCQPFIPCWMDFSDIPVVSHHDEREEA